MFLAGGLLSLMAGQALAQTVTSFVPDAAPVTATVPPAAVVPTSALFSQGAVDAELEAARSWLQLSMVDYESARFMRVQVALISPDRRNRRDVILVVCGLVNGRNRMGGYTGFQPFWYGSRLPAWRQSGIAGQANDICGPANRLSTTDYSDRIGPPSSAGAGR